jgi:uncharacterized protein (DUF58 family)
VREVLGAEPTHRGTDIGAALQAVSSLVRRRAVVFLLSDFESPGGSLDTTAGLRDAVRVARRRHDLVALHLFDPREMTLPDVGLLTLEDAETGELVEVDTGKKKTRDLYAELAAARQLATARFFRREGVECLELDSALPYVPPLLGFFRSRERRLH